MLLSRHLGTCKEDGELPSISSSLVFNDNEQIFSALS